MKALRLYMLAAVVAAAVATLVASAPDLLAFVFVIGVAFLVAFLHVLFLGLPIALALKALDCARWWALALVGFIVGAAPLAVVHWLTDFPAELSFAIEPQWIPLLGLYGALGGLAFWLVIRRAPKPDPQPPNSASEQRKSPGLIRKLKALMGI